MKPLDVALAITVAVLWGFAFIATKLGLESFSPSELTLLRFMIAAIPALWLPRPPVSWAVLVPIGSTLFAGQFLLQFFALTNGMPPGLASVVVQIQAFFTVCIAAMILGDKPTARQLAGMAVALAGLVIIGLTVGQGLTLAGLVLTVASALSWSIGNVLVKRLPSVHTLNLMVWLSLIPPLPALALSIMLDGSLSLPHALLQASWLSIGGALYLGIFATTVAYALWGHLLHRYPTAMVVPFALLTPCVGVLSSAMIFGERFGTLRLAGLTLMLFGLALVVLPFDRLATRYLQRRT